jgi:hypothetical protein
MTTRAPNVVNPIRAWTSLIGGARAIGAPPAPAEGGIFSQGAPSAPTAAGAAVAKAVVAPVPAAAAAAAPLASASSKPAAAVGVRQPGLSYKLALGSASSSASAKGEQTLVTAGEDTLGVATSSDVADGAASRLKQYYPANSPWALLQGTVQASAFDADAADDVGAAGPPSISRGLKAPPLSADLASAEEFVPGAFGFAS